MTLILDVSIYIQFENACKLLKYEINGEDPENWVLVSAGEKLLMVGWFGSEGNDTHGQVQGRDLLVINVPDHVTETGETLAKKPLSDSS